MPLEPQFRKAIDAQWSFKIMDMDRRIAAFKDLSQGEVTTWKWDFGDGTTSVEQNPTHEYKDKPRQGGYLYGDSECYGPCGNVAHGEGVGRA